jgi:hypothetical protein
MSRAQSQFSGTISAMKIAILILLLITVSACQSQRGRDPEAVPTIASVEALATALPLTLNAPPPPYNTETRDFALIDNRLTELPDWRYVVQLEFTGTFTGTEQTTSATARAEVQFNQLASARRVTVTTTGELLGEGAGVNYEAVRLGPDAFLVRDGACLSNAPNDAETAADLRAGELVGGFTVATPAGRRATINGEDVYAFAFTPEDFRLPAIQLGDGGRLTIDSYELWISPERGAVIRFYANVSVENALIFARQQPVTGLVLLRYDLYEIGTDYNITVPFGC